MIHFAVACADSSNHRDRWKISWQHSFACSDRVKVKRSPYLLIRLLFSILLGRRPNCNSVGIIVFSKDRPLQLHSLLESILRHVSGNFSVTVLYQTSNSEFDEGYSTLRTMSWPLNINFVKESNFRDDLISQLSQLRTEAVMFLVDDIVFIRSFHVDWLQNIDLRKVVPSIRLDDRVSYSQPSSTECVVPKIRRTSVNPWLSFRWTEGSLYWAMPLSVDGNIFARRDILSLTRYTSYSAPNSLEKAFGPYRLLFKYRSGYCLPHRAILNLAFNRVQAENEDFPCGDVSSDELLDRWRARETLDTDAMKNAEGNACHVIANPCFRTIVPSHERCDNES